MERQHADALKAAQAARFVVRTLKILDHCYGCFCETVIDMACDYMAVYVFFFMFIIVVIVFLPWLSSACPGNIAVINLLWMPYHASTRITSSPS